MCFTGAFTWHCIHRTVQVSPGGATMSSDSPGELAGRTAIITGSGQNVGRAIAIAFAREGANVVVNGHRKRKAVEQVVAEIKAFGGSAAGIMADVGDERAVSDMV